MATFSSIWTPFRRPCLLRSEVESHIDAPQGKRTSVTPRSSSREGFGTSTLGGGAPDSRSITIDMPARSISIPRSSGLHRGNVGAPSEHQQPSKQDQIRTQQSLGIGNVFNLDLIPTRRSSYRSSSIPREASTESPGSPRYSRTKVEHLHSMPLYGRGADIDLLGGRRCQGYGTLKSSSLRDTQPCLDGIHACSPTEAKTELCSISIHQGFHRRHFSAPPDTRTCEKFSHVMHAEGYANLLGRPEGTGRRANQGDSPMRRSRSQQSRRCFSPDRPFHVESRNLNGALFSSTSGSLYANSVDDAKEFNNFRFRAGDHEAPLSTNNPMQSVALIAALREATQHVPAEAVWDSMLNAFESPERLSPEDSLRDMHLLSSPANLTAILAASVAKDDISGTQRCAAGQRVGSPVKPGRQEQENISPVRSTRAPIGRNASDVSLMSMSTAADVEGASRTTSKVDNTAASIESVSAVSSPGGALRQPRPCRKSVSSMSAAGWLREEHRKSQRRASWVA